MPRWPECQEVVLELGINIDMSAPTLNLNAKFAVYSLLIITIIGLVIGAVLTDQIRSQLFNDYVARALAIQRAVIAHDVFPSDFQPGSKRLAGPAFHRFVTKSVISKEFIFMRIVRRNGTVLYSNNRGLIGKRLESEEDEEEATGGRTTYKEEPALEGRPDSGPVLDLYSPIKFKGRVVGAFEAYFSLKSLYARQRTIIVSVISLLTGGLALLWLALYGMVRGASATIERQTAGLQRLSDNLANSLDQLRRNYLGTMESLAHTVEARDPYTGGHSHRLESLSVAVSRQLKLSEEQAARLERAGELHDIGKIGIPEAILAKPGPLNPDEWKVMKDHPVVGAEIVRRIPFLRDVAPIVKHHHEHYDGSGYPDGLAGDDIPFEARVLTVLDAFDAMISDRPYRKALSLETAVGELQVAAGSQFDPAIVEAFLDLYHRRQDLFRHLKAA